MSLKNQLSNSISILFPQSHFLIKIVMLYEHLFKSQMFSDYSDTELYDLHTILGKRY